MRREMKFGIAILVAVVGVGAWLYNMVGIRPHSPASTTRLVESGPPAPTRQPRHRPSPRTTVRRSGERVSGANTGLAGSPAAAGGPESLAPSYRPRPVEVSPPTPPASERLGLTDTTLEHGPAAVSAPPANGASTTTGTPSVPPTTPVAETAAPAAPPQASPVTGLAVSDSARPTGPSTSPSGEQKIHVVQAGETFSSISSQHYGTTKYTRLIMAANPNVDARRLHVGTKIKIPPAPAGTTPSGSPTSRPAAASSAAPVPPERAYTVQPGESWNDLAKRFLGNGNRWTELYELNKERVPRNVHILPAGTVLELPADAKKP